MAQKGAPAARAQRISVIACPWHNNSRPHPGGAPECAIPVGDLSVGRVVPMGDLITWLALVVSELGIQWAALLDAADIELVPEEEAAVEALAAIADDLATEREDMVFTSPSIVEGEPPEMGGYGVLTPGEDSNPDIVAAVAAIEGAGDAG